MTNLYELPHTIVVTQKICGLDGIVSVDVAWKVLRHTKHLQRMQRLTVQQVQPAALLLIG